MARSALLTLMLALPACEPGDPLAEARQLQSAGLYEESLEPLRRLIDEGVRDPEVDFLYGVSLQWSRNGTAAIYPLSRAMQDPDWELRAALQLSNGALQLGDYPLAIASAERVLALEPDHTGALTLRATARMQTRQDYEGALADADHALELDPEIGQAHVVRAVSLMGLDRVEEAGPAIDAVQDHLEASGSQLAETARYCVARATFQKEKGQPDEADEIFAECLEKHPTSVIAVEEAIKFYDELARYDRSTEIIRNAYESDTRSRGFRIALVKRLIANGQSGEADRLLHEATLAKNQRLAATGWADLAGFLMERDDVDAGVAAYRKSVELSGEPSPQLLFMLADALVIAGRYDEALELAETMRVTAYRELVRGRVHMERREFEQALAFFSAGLEIWPDNAVARYLAARAALETGDLDRAIEEYRYAIRAGVGATDARRMLARLYIAEGSPALALAVIHHDVASKPLSFETALLELELLERRAPSHGKLPPRLATMFSPEPRWAPAVVALARGAREARGPDAAIEFIRSASRVDPLQPKNAEVLRLLADCLVEAGRRAEAVEEIDRALETNPDHAELHAIKALVLIEVGGEPDSARSEAQRAVFLDPESALALLVLGRAMTNDGEVDQAISLFERSAASDGVETEPLMRAAALMASSGRLQEAEATLESALERDPFDGAAAYHLAELREARGAEPARTLALARRAARFRHGRAADELVSRLAPES
jgi:tetratricopeptide (TPR) repeat protein